MLLLWGSVLYRAGTGWHGNAKARAQTLNAHCLVQFPFFAAQKPGMRYAARSTHSRSVRPNGRDVRAVGL